MRTAIVASPVLTIVPLAAAATIVCGMTLLPANPKIDPAMKVAPPNDRRFTMRNVEPTICRGR